MKRPVVIGLTGSIGMGKSTTATMFREAGVPVWDADAAVHRLYEKDGAGTEAIRDLCPDAVGEAGVDRTILRTKIDDDPGLLKRIEAVIHPLVAADRASFIAAQTAPLVVVDVPLLFETGAEGSVDVVVVVSAPEADQRARVLARPGMTDARLDAILARQTPDAEKRKRADYVIETTSLEAARHQVHDVIEAIKKRSGHA